MGRIYDERGSRMTPTYATKNGVRYRYYISAALVQGGTGPRQKLDRLPAAEIEKVVADAVRKHLGNTPGGGGDDRGVISSNVDRVDVKRGHLAIQLSTPGAQDNRSICSTENEVMPPNPKSTAGKRRRAQEPPTLEIVWTKTPSKKPRELIPATLTSSRSDLRPIRDSDQAYRRNCQRSALAR